MKTLQILTLVALGLIGFQQWQDHQLLAKMASAKPQTKIVRTIVRPHIAIRIKRQAVKAIDRIELEVNRRLAIREELKQEMTRR
jgi:hypothetical protein